ncbi:MAG: lysylphosphatidylglycerol synthase transmembrane domain-containing protein [Ferruginibacter sp.]|nr:flippase-like domain-containing protein [Ferruginibacter sp.]
MNKKILSALQYILFLGGGLLLVWWQLHGMTDIEKSDFFYAIKHANYILIVPVVLMSLASHLVRSMRWKLLMEPLGYTPKLSNVFAVTMAGYLANSAIPRLGEVLKCSMLAKYEKLKIDKLIGTIIIERAFDLICYFILIVITVFIQLDLIGNYVKEKLELLSKTSGMPWWQKAALLLAIILIITYSFKKIISLYPNNKLLLIIKNFALGIANGVASVKNMKQRKAFILYTIFIWSMYLLQIYLGFKAMEATAYLGIKAACAVLSLSTLAMIVTPGGIGSFPIFVMQTLSIYGVATSQGKAYGWLIWGVSTAIIIVVGLISFLIIPYLNKQNIDKINTTNILQ